MSWQLTRTERLLEKVIDLEVAAGTASPTIDPSVRTVLIGHSMGGIVAAETLIALSSDKPVEFSSSQDDDATSTDGGRESGGSSSSANAKSHQTNSNSQKRDLPTTGAPIADAATGGFHYNGLMFPYIQGVLAFDTPFLGISPGVVAHGAEGRYAAASELASQLSGLAALWGGAKAATSTSSSGPSKAVAALPAPPSPAAGGNASGWAKWGRVAMIAGAGAAIAAGGAAAYLHRDTIGAGWGWISSHLEFVGCLARAEELRRRVAYVVGAGEELGVGFANLYTRLGKGATTASAKNQSGGGGTSVAGAIVGSNRTFCNLPTRMKAGAWIEAVNDKAADETSAHMCEFASLFSNDRLAQRGPRSP